jgi:hypothetical protein
MRLLLHMEDCEVVRVEATFNEHLKRGLLQPITLFKGARSLLEALRCTLPIA